MLIFSSPASWVKVRVIGVGPEPSRDQSTSMRVTSIPSGTWTLHPVPSVQWTVMVTEAVTFTHLVSLVLAPSSSSTSSVAK